MGRNKRKKQVFKHLLFDPFASKRSGEEINEMEMVKKAIDEVSGYDSDSGDEHEFDKLTEEVDIPKIKNSTEILNEQSKTLISWDYDRSGLETIIKQSEICIVERVLT